LKIFLILRVDEASVQTILTQMFVPSVLVSIVMKTLMSGTEFLN